jgi:sugar (pentulose or hexulose) kinase
VEYFIGIDIGTYESKGTLVDEHGSLHDRTSSWLASLES